MDKTIAEVELKGEDSQTVETQVKAQLATAQANFDGEKKSLDSCLFTFDKVENKDNTYKISAQAGDAKVYVNHKTRLLSVYVQQQKQKLLETKRQMERLH